MSGHKGKLDNFRKALSRLIDGLERYDRQDDLSRDGIIQRFEFTFELAWKSLKALFEFEGIIGLNSPKSVLREAFAAGLVLEESLWLSMLNDRNSTSHIYDEGVAMAISQRVQDLYAPEFSALADRMESRMAN